jgi:IS5 family transposase
MLNKTTPDTQQSFFFNLADTLDSRHPLFVLAGKLDWGAFESAFSAHYHPTHGRPAKPIRLMVGLLILKHVRNVSDESVVEQWGENTYYQHFCGNAQFTPCAPCEASELVHFRERIGQAGMELIFRESVRVNGEDAKEPDVVVDTTVQEKNVTFPTDSKLHRKVIAKCRQIAKAEGLEPRQSYTRTLKRLYTEQRFRNHPKNGARARKADRKVKGIAGRLVRELERKLPPRSKWCGDLALYKRVLAQQKGDAGKVYSLHEPGVQCIAKGKEHKKYEFGNKVSLTKTLTTNVIVGVLSLRNEYDGHTLEPALAQHEGVTGVRAETATGDRGYRGQAQTGVTKIQVPHPFSDKKLTRYRQRKMRRDFRRRAAIEPVIGHVKSDHRMGRNFYKGIVGDAVNALLAAAAFNFKRMMNKWGRLLPLFVRRFFAPILPSPAWHHARAA